jgi:Ni/Fe-hydrogenase 1 B-type cytochrome subunit
MAELKQVRIWSGWVRAAHWLLAGATLTALATGGLMAWGREAAPPLWIAARAIHVPAGEVMLLALAVRLVLLVTGSGSAGWRDFLPRRGQWGAAWSALRFYLTATRSPLPAYYAHNPLWGPLYLVLFGLLALQGALGLWLELPAVRGLLALDYAAGLRWHQGLAYAVAGLAVAHILAAVVHDWRGRRWDVSAMINGDKVFEIRRPEAGMSFGGVAIRSAAPDAAGHWEPPGEGS